MLSQPQGTLTAGAILLDRFALLGRVGVGMGGETWRARALDGSGDVAIKVVHHGGLRLRQHLDLLREAAILRGLEHPHVVPYLGVVDLPGTSATYLLIQWARGGNLAGWMVGRGRLPAARVRMLGMQLCAALEAAHSAGILHRDLKPENVLLREPDPDNPHLLLADFGIAQRMSQQAADVSRPAGSPGYSAPECWRAGTITAAADVYSLGALILTLARGSPPPLAFDGMQPDLDEAQERLNRVSDPDLRVVTELALAMMAREPESRPRVIDVREVLEGKSRSVPRRSGITTVPPAPATTARRRQPRWWLYLAAASVLVATLAAVVVAVLVAAT